MSYAIPAIGQEAPELLQQQNGQLSASGMPYYMYEQYKRAIGQQKDAFHRSQEPERSLFFLKSRAGDGFFKTLGKSLWNAGVAGPANFIQKQIYNKEEGFFRALKTAGVIIGFGAAMSAGMAIAPMLTTAGIAMFSAVGLGLAGMKGLKHSASWVGHVVKGDYKDAVEDAHDMGDVAAEGAMAALGLRQTTSMAMRLSNVEGVSAGATSTFNIRRSVTDMVNTLFRRNYWRDSLLEAQRGIRNFKQDVMLNTYSGNNNEFRQLLETAQKGGQDVLIESARRTNPGAEARNYTQRVFKNHELSNDFQGALADAGGNMVLRRPILRRDGTIDFVVELKIPGDLNALAPAAREASTRQFVLSAKPMPRTGARVAPQKVTRPDGSSYYIDTLKDVGVGIGEHESARLATDPLGRMWQGFNFKRRGAINSVKDMGTGIKERIMGESIATRANRFLNSDPDAYRVLTPEGNIARLLSDRALSEAEFQTLTRMTDVIEPTLFDKVSGFTRTVMSYMYDGLRASTTQHNVQHADGQVMPHVRSTIVTHLRRELGNISADDIMYVGQLEASAPVNGNVTQTFYALVNEGGTYRTRTINFTYPEGPSGAVARLISENPGRLKDAIPAGGSRGIVRRFSDWLGDTGPHNRPTFNVNQLPAFLRGESLAAYSNRLVALGHFATRAEANAFMTNYANNMRHFIAVAPAASRARLRAAFGSNIPRELVNQNLSHFGQRSSLYSTITAPLAPGYKGAESAFDLTPEPNEDDATQSSSSAMGSTPSGLYGGHGAQPVFSANPFSNSSSLINKHPFGVDRRLG